jgi:hypothetical protein
VLRLWNRGNETRGDGGTTERRAGDRSLRRRMDRADKARGGREEAQKRARRAAKGVRGAIGYDLMYEDGTCQVEEGLFSQTIAFDDISYQKARVESQQAIFSGWSQIYDYLGAGCGMQLTVCNTPVPADEIGARDFFPGAPEAAKQYAEEYNRILNDKMREGVSNLVRERYLTFSVGAESVDAAVPKLARLRGDASQRLAAIRCGSRMLDGGERLKSISSLLRPGAPFSVDWGEIGAASGLSTKDLVSPMTLDFKPGGSGSCYRSDGVWCQALVLRRFGSELLDNCLASIIDLPIPLSVSLHVRPIDKSRAVDYVMKRIAWMDKEIVDEQMSAVKKGYDFQILPTELKYSKAEAEDLLDSLQHRNQMLFAYTGLAFTYADTRDELDRRVEQIVGTARSNGIGIESLDYRQREGMNSILPLGHNHVRVGRMMTTSQVAIQLPFATQELFQPGGGYYGQNKISGNLVVVNRMTLPSPMGFFCGTPGSGKSFSVKREIVNTILTHPDDEVIVLDPAGEYSPIAEGTGGTSVRFAPDSDTHLNPFDLSDVAHQSTAAQTAFKIDAFLALSSATMAESGRDLSEADKSIISRCVELAYVRCASEGRVPVLQDLRRILLEQPEPEARGIALRYERFCVGATSFFNHESNVSLDRHVTNVDFRELSESMRAFGIIAVLESVRNRMYYNFERGVTTWLYIDEVQSLFGHPAIISYFSKFWAEGRKFNLVATGITQNSVYMLDHEEARNMVLNSDFIMLHKQSPLDRKAWADLLSLSGEEEDYINDGIRAGEGLLIAGGAKIPIKDDFPRGKLYDLFNTKPEEIAAMKKASEFARRARERKEAERGGRADG